MKAATELTEAHRRHYLDAMGIASWYPRVRLACAREPLQLVDAATQSPSPPQVASPVSQALGQTPASRAETPSTTESPEALVAQAQAEAPVAVNQRIKALSVPRFALSISVMGDYLITDTLPRGAEQPSAEGQQLLVNILSALGHSDQGVRLHHVIQWPLFTNRRVDQSIEQARLYVDEKLDQFISQFEPRLLLSFGAAMPKLQGWQQPTGYHSGLPWVALPSLYRMLADHRQKAVAWNRLRESLLKTP